MAALTGLWTPPLGMGREAIADWRAFYRRVLDIYGLTPQGYRDLYIAQHGTCYICRKAVGKNPDDPSNRGRRRLGVDHNHVTGQVRGLLCTGGDKTCNRIIGWLTPQALQRAIVYLETEPGRAVRDARQAINDCESVANEAFPDPDGFMATVLGLK